MSDFGVCSTCWFPTFHHRLTGHQRACWWQRRKLWSWATNPEHTLGSLSMFLKTLRTSFCLGKKLHLNIWSYMHLLRRIICTSIVNWTSDSYMHKWRLEAVLRKLYVWRENLHLLVFIYVYTLHVMCFRPAYATPKVLERAGLKMSDISVFEFHEAFAVS